MLFPSVPPTHDLQSMAKWGPASTVRCILFTVAGLTGKPFQNRLSVFISSSYIDHNLVSKILPTMCEYTKNYYIYTTCHDPGAHFFRTSIDGSRKTACPRGPHERYIVQPGQCPLCG
ncbi:hypothetical protein F4860DRAFT_318620 [Xylaria cubensis]|nr:hypothetical protein F4860DRAFT_318620 [Xylaria cubensis]